MSSKLINVGIADIKVATSPDVLRTILGSCIGICLYDKNKKIAGISHIMLPNQKFKESNPKKYADTAIPILVSMMLEEGAERKNLTAKLVGGATMFKLAEGSQMGEIGKNNTKRVREVLKASDITVISEDVGGDYGRTIDFYTDTGLISIKSLGKVLKQI